MVEVGFGANKWGINANQHAPVVLYGADGSPLAIENGAIVGGSQGLLTQTVNDGVARLTRGDRWGNLSVALHQPQLSPDIEGATLNTAQWSTSLTTMTIAQVTGQITLNASAITTINTNAILQSLKRFKKASRAVMQAKTRLRWSQVANSVAEWGFGLPVGVTAQQTNGAFFQVTSSGTLQCVLTINSVDITAPITIAGYNATNYYTYDILLDDDQVTFIVQNTFDEVVGEAVIRLPASALRIWLDSHLPVFYRVYNTGTAPTTAPIFIVSDAWMVTTVDANYNTPVSDLFGVLGFGSVANPQSGAQLATFANSTAPVNVPTPSNTSAGYTTLGGLFSFTPPAGAATDYLLFAFTVPTSHSLVIKGIQISAFNAGAAVATTPTLLEWGIGVNGTAANLSTGAFLRRLLGMQSFAVGAAIGAAAQDIVRQFATPLICEAGRIVAIIVRMPVGTATGSQTIQGHVDIDGYFV